MKTSAEMSLYELKKVSSAEDPKEKLKVSKEEMTWVQSLAGWRPWSFRPSWRKELMWHLAGKTAKQKKENG